MLDVLAVENSENVWFEVPCGTFLAHKSDFIEGHCTHYCNENLIKPPSLHISVDHVHVLVHIHVYGKELILT